MFRVVAIIGLFTIVLCADYPKSDNVVQLNSDNYKQFIGEKSKSMVLWFSHRCKICNSIMPNYELAAKYSAIPLARINILKNKELADETDVDGYPTALFYNDGKKTEYQGALTTVAILEYLSHYEESRR